MSRRGIEKGGMEGRRRQKGRGRSETEMRQRREMKEKQEIGDRARGDAGGGRWTEERGRRKAGEGLRIISGETGVCKKPTGRGRGRQGRR